MVSKNFLSHSNCALLLVGALRFDLLSASYALAALAVGIRRLLLFSSISASTCANAGALMGSQKRNKHS